MTELNLPYSVWDHKSDVRLFRPVSAQGVDVLQASLDIDKAPTVRQGRRDPAIGPALDGVIGLLAGAVEWLRWYGMSAEEVQARVNAYIADNKGRQDQQNMLVLQRKVREAIG